MLGTDSLWIDLCFIVSFNNGQKQVVSESMNAVFPAVSIDQLDAVPSSRIVCDRLFFLNALGVTRKTFVASETH